jgi:hypothetical protein
LVSQVTGRRALSLGIVAGRKEIRRKRWQRHRTLCSGDKVPFVQMALARQSLELD